MDQIIALNVFQKVDDEGNGIPLLGTPVSASYIDKTENVVYSAAQPDVEEPAA